MAVLKSKSWTFVLQQEEGPTVHLASLAEAVNLAERGEKGTLVWLTAINLQHRP
jgi:hypothetical protein